MSKRNRTFGLMALALVLASAAQAQDVRLGAIRIEQARARATVPGQPVAAGYVTLTNEGPVDRLLSASAEVGKTTELHEMKMQGDTMRMSPVTAIELPQGKAVALKPGGLHIMFMALKAPLKAGDSFPMRLRFERAGEAVVNVRVEAATAPAGGPGVKH